MGAQRRMKRKVLKASGNLPTRKLLMATISQLHQQVQDANTLFKLADHALCAVVEKDLVLPISLLHKPVRNVKLTVNPANKEEFLLTVTALEEKEATDVQAL